MIFKTYYGWEAFGLFYLSVFPPNVGTRNEYRTREEAIAAATKRGAEIKWL